MLAQSSSENQSKFTDQEKFLIYLEFCRLTSGAKDYAETVEHAVSAIYHGTTEFPWMQFTNEEVRRLRLQAIDNVIERRQR